MPFRFRRVLPLGRLLRVYLSKSGASLSVGRAPFTVNLNPRRTRLTTSLPGSGLSYYADVPHRRRRGQLPYRWPFWQWMVLGLALLGVAFAVLQ